MPYNTDDGDGDYDGDATKMLSFSFEQRFRVCFANDLEYPLLNKWAEKTESIEWVLQQHTKSVRIEHT